MSPLNWPLGLRILPGADPYRLKIEGLFRIATAQAMAGRLNPLLLQEIARAVRELKKHLNKDKNDRLSLTWSMYERSEHFLRVLERAPQIFAAMNFPSSFNPYWPAPPSPPGPAKGN